MIEIQTEIERLQFELRHAREASVILHGDPEATETYNALRTERDAAEARATALEQRLALAVEALGPLKALGDAIFTTAGSEDDWKLNVPDASAIFSFCGVPLTAGDLRRARSVLAQLTEER